MDRRPLKVDIRIIILIEVVTALQAVLVAFAPTWMPSQVVPFTLPLFVVVTALLIGLLIWQRKRSDGQQSLKPGVVPLTREQENDLRYLRAIARAGHLTVEQLRAELALAEADFDETDRSLADRDYIRCIPGIRFITEPGRRFLETLSGEHA